MLVRVTKASGRMVIVAETARYFLDKIMTTGCGILVRGCAVGRHVVLHSQILVDDYVAKIGFK